VRKRFLAVVTALAMMVTSHADGQTNGEKLDSNGIGNTSPSTADFVKFAAIGAMFEIESSRLAAERADLASKKFAATIIEEHTKTLAEIRRWGLRPA
jgi:putative membrane protein